MLRTSSALRTLSLVTPLVACGLWSATAQAGGFAVARFGGEHGHPATDNPTALYYNPAGMAESEGTNIVLDGVLAGRFATYDRPFSAQENNDPNQQLPGSEGANYGEASLSNFIASPSLFVTSDFGTDWIAAGAGIYFPFGGQASWDKNDRFKNSEDFPGAFDGPQRWHTMDGTIRSMYVTGGVAFKIKQAGLSIGVNGSAIRTEADTIRARNSDGSDTLGVLANGEVRLVEGRSWIDTEGWQGGFAVGLLWDFGKLFTEDGRYFFGASYTSQPNVVGGMRLKGDLRQVLGSGTPDKSTVELEQTLPDIVRFGFRIRPKDKWELRLMGDFQHWAVFDRQCVVNVGTDCGITGHDEDASYAENRRNVFDNPGQYGAETSMAGDVILNIPRYWRNSGGVRAGFSYWFIEPLETYVGIAYDHNAVPPQTLEAALIDQNKVIPSIGLKYQIVKQFALALTLQQVIYFEREITNSQLDEYNPPSRQPSGNGTYNQFITLANIYAQVTFGHKGKNKGTEAEVTTP